MEVISVPRKVPKWGNLLRHPRDQWRKVNFCPCRWQSYGGNRNKAHVGMAWGVLGAKPHGLWVIFQKNIEKYQKCEFLLILEGRNDHFVSRI